MKRLHAFTTMIMLMATILVVPDTPSYLLSKRLYFLKFTIEFFSLLFINNIPIKVYTFYKDIPHNIIGINDSLIKVGHSSLYFLKQHNFLMKHFKDITYPHGDFNSYPSI